MTGAAPTVRTPSPDAGEHTGTVLDELGFSAAEVAELRAAGAVP
jgi:crotonobetainyl-CoA:carnitine CoA-transferase CaiB-like acyl-CoA transferase